MNRFTLIVIGACVCGVLLTSNAVFAADPVPYKIGFSFCLTGRAANIGEGERRGALIKMEEINAAGGVHGRRLEAIVYDQEGKPANAVLNTKKLINVDKVVALAGYNTSGTSMAAIEPATTGETPLIGGGATEKTWIPTRKWIYSIVPRQKDGCTNILIDNLLERGSKNIAYIYIDTAYGQTGREAFEWYCKKTGIKPAIIEKYTPGTTDVSPQITHIKTSGADGLIVCGYIADTAMVIKTARDLGIDYPVTSEYAVVGPEFIELAGKYGEGIVTTTIKTLVAKDLSDTDVQKKVTMDLYNKYVEKHGAFSLYAGHGWDQVNLINEALKKVDPKLDPSDEEDLIKIRAKIRDNLEGLKGIIGQNGVFNYSADNHNGLKPRSYVPVVIKNGKWRLYKAGR